MPALVASGRAIDFVLLFVLLEGLLLWAAWQFAGRGLRPREIVTTLLPGACLMMALRASLYGQSAVAITGWLTAALVAHLTDLALRWK